LPSTNSKTLPHSTHSYSWTDTGASPFMAAWLSPAGRDTTDTLFL
jgi:hypothetical protein